MKRLAIIAMAALAIALPRPANAASIDTSTGNGLQAACSERDGSVAASICAGYIIGASNMASATRVYCAPDGVTNSQLIDVVLNGIRSDAANRHRHSAFLVATYLSAAFPCSK